MLTPQLSGLADSRHHGAPIGIVPILSAFECEKTLDQQFTLLEVLLLDLILCLKVFTARFKGFLRSRMKTLPVRLGIVTGTFTQRAPLLLKILDVPGERSGMQRRPDERLHALDQFRAF